MQTEAETEKNQGPGSALIGQLGIAHQSTAREQELLNQLTNAYHELKSLGWKEAIYCPKDYSRVLLIEAGSTGIHLGSRDEISFWVSDGNDTWPSDPILFKPSRGA